MQDVIIHQADPLHLIYHLIIYPLVSSEQQYFSIIVIIKKSFAKKTAYCGL